MAREQPVVARDFLGIGMGDILSGDTVVMGKQNLSPGADHHHPVPPLLNNMQAAMAGVENSAWSKAATMQLFIPLRGSPDDRFKEQIAENLPESSFPHIGPPLQILDLAGCNQKNGLRTQGDSLINSNVKVREEYGSSIPLSGGFRGSSTRTTISPTSKASEAKAVNGPLAASELRLPSSGMMDVEHDTALTIFYAGSVKVFNNISPEQAEAIMVLASTRNVLQLGNHAAVAVNSTKATDACPHDKSVINIHLPAAALNHLAAATSNMQLHDFDNLTPPTTTAPPPHDHHHQPMVPTALPHARKASLARFLEKRRERAHSKCPYNPGVKREDSCFVEERLSSSNDPTAACASYSGHTPARLINTDGRRIDKKQAQRNMPSWMEGPCT